LSQKSELTSFPDESTLRYPAVSEKLLLLDVGSCFDPFSEYEDVYSVAIDLQPAEKVS